MSGCWASTAGSALGLPVLESHGEEYALQSGVLDEKVLETGMAMASPTTTRLPARVPPAGCSPPKRRWAMARVAPSEVLTVALDVTELRAAEATTASTERRRILLTGLPSGEHFRSRFEHELARDPPAARDAGPAAPRSRPLQGHQRRVRQGVRLRAAARGRRSAEGTADRQRDAWRAWRATSS